MKRRRFLSTFGLLIAPAWAADPERLQGTLTSDPAIKQRTGRSVRLTGDKPTMLVLEDKRLAGRELEVLGAQTSPDLFTVGPMHTKSMFVMQDGKRLMITYWCDVCYIRTYAPGPCWCCQKETDLDLRDPATL